jgi:hypothetical protein
MEQEVTGGEALVGTTAEDPQIVKDHEFQAISQLLNLVVTLSPWDPSPEDKTTSGTRKSFDYVDAITNLMVRNAEVVAAVTCGGQYPSRGIISVNSSNDETPSRENAQVRPQYTSYV